MMWLTGVLSTIGSAIGGLFKLKGKKAEVLDSAIKTIGSATANLDDKKAAAAVIVAEAGSESWLTRTWRPLTMVIFLGLLVSYWFGYVPPNIDAPMPDTIARLFDLIEMGLLGYIGSRTLEKIVTSLNLNKVIGQFLK